MRVLISAYACEPGKGSEPEVGWQWALQMARFHEVTVLTRSNNQPAIEAGLAPLRGKQPLPTFIYHDESRFLRRIKKWPGFTQLYYIIWQSSARELVVRLHKACPFDLLHHVTFAGFRYPAAIWGHGVPCIWGPIGGIESVPIQLLPLSHPISLSIEIARTVHNLIQASPFQILPQRAAASTVVLASTPEMHRVLQRHGFKALLKPTIGLHVQNLPALPAFAPKGALKLLFVGKIITLKGVDLALRAAAASGTDATITLLGDGNYLSAARRLAARLGLGDRARFSGRPSREEVLKLYPQFDAFIFPSVHDTGGYAVIEAMSRGLPVICVDYGGPGLAVRENCGSKIPLGSRSAMVQGLAKAIRFYDHDRNKILEHGKAAQQTIINEYDWNRKGEHMNQIYQQAMAMAPHRRPRLQAAGDATGIGTTANFLHRFFSLKGMTVTLLVLLLIGSIEFLSLSRLKSQAREIVNDTLPGLSYAGSANAYLSDAYRTLLFIYTDDNSQRADIHNQMDSLAERTSTFLNKYQASIFSSDDRRNFDAVVSLRADYLKTRSDILALAGSGHRDEALSLFHHTLMPTQLKLKQAGEKLLTYNMNQGEQRGRAIMHICTLTQIAVAFIGVFIFIFGFFVGLSR